jgi:hypothetical protein
MLNIEPAYRSIVALCRFSSEKIDIIKYEWADPLSDRLKLLDAVPVLLLQAVPRVSSGIV